MGSLVLLTTLAQSIIASAQTSSSDPAPAESTRAAADAYDKGSARYALHDYASAADWFELADRLLPDMAALQASIRAHRQAGAPAHLARAASLALVLRARYPKDRVSTRLADEVITSASPSMARITVRCDECHVDVDGVPQPGPDVFVTPGEHRLVMRSVGVAEASRTIDARAGKTEVVDGGAAEPAGAGHALGDAAAPPPLAMAPAREASHGLAPGFAIGGAVLTAVLGTATAVSWFGDALPEGRRLVRDARASHQADAAQEDRVSAAETRTSVLLATTVAAGAATLVVSLFFTRWRDDHAITAAALPGGRGYVLGARF